MVKIERKLNRKQKTTEKIKLNQEFIEKKSTKFMISLARPMGAQRATIWNSRCYVTTDSI